MTSRSEGKTRLNKSLLITKTSMKKLGQYLIRNQQLFYLFSLQTLGNPRDYYMKKVLYQKSMFLVAF